MSPHLAVAVIVSWIQSQDACLNVASVIGPHTVSDAGVHVDFTPSEHVEMAVHVAHGAWPERENDVPAAHATWHTVSVVLVQAVFTPATHVEPAVQGEHGVLPDLENVVPAAHVVPASA